MTIKDSKNVKINSLNPLYLIIHKVNGYFQEINKSKYLKLVPITESKEKIRSTANNSDDYDEKYL